MSDSVWPHRWNPTRLPCPWDSLGKNTGVGCHFLLQYIKVKIEREVTQSCLTLSDPMGDPRLLHSWDFPGKSTRVGCHVTSTHFPCSLQNRSNCRTVLYLRDPPTGHYLPSSNGYRGHVVSHRKTRCVFFKPWGSNLSQFFRIQFTGVRLELLAPICKREKSDQGHFSTGGVPPCSRWGCRQTLHQKLFFPGPT